MLEDVGVERQLKIKHAKALVVGAGCLGESNPNVTCIVFDELLQESNAANIISQFDIVVDSSDNFLTRYLDNQL